MRTDTLLNIENFKNGGKMADKTILLALLLLLIPMISADPSFTFQQNGATNLKISCFDVNNTLCSSATDCYLTVQYPDLTTDLVKNGTLTFQSDYYNYTLPSLNESGIYSVVVRCEGTDNAFSTFTFEVTPTGKPQTSILDNPMLIVLALLGLLLVGFGAYFSNPWFGFIGSIMFLFGGIYTMVYGFNNVTDLYTRGIGVTFIGLGFIFMFTAAYEWVWGGRET